MVLSGPVLPPEGAYEPAIEYPVAFQQLVTSKWQGFPGK